MVAEIWASVISSFVDQLVALTVEFDGCRRIDIDGHIELLASYVTLNCAIPVYGQKHCNLF